MDSRGHKVYTNQNSLISEDDESQIRALEKRIEELTDIIPGSRKFIDQQHAESDFQKLEPLKQLIFIENVLQRVKLKIEGSETNDKGVTSKDVLRKFRQETATHPIRDVEAAEIRMLQERRERREQIRIKEQEEYEAKERMNKE